MFDNFTVIHDEPQPVETSLQQIQWLLARIQEGHESEGGPGFWNQKQIAKDLERTVLELGIIWLYKNRRPTFSAMIIPDELRKWFTIDQHS